jgi:alpha-glucan,water dikinase
LSQLRKQLFEFGIAESDFAKAWTSIKKVWASKFNERAFLAVKKIGVTLDQVFMAVLIQKIVKAQYAFVVHTTNPTNGEDSEVYVEACRGLGESLVSDMPG